MSSNKRNTEDVSEGSAQEASQPHQDTAIDHVVSAVAMEDEPAVAASSSSETGEDGGVVEGGEQEESVPPTEQQEPPATQVPKELDLGAPEKVISTSSSGASIITKQLKVGETIELNDSMVRT